MPEETSVATTAIDGELRIVADQKAGQAGVIANLFDEHPECGVLSPILAKEASHKVLGALKHTVLGRCTSEDLGRGVVQLTVLVVMVHPRVKHPTRKSTSAKYIRRNACHLLLPTPRSLYFRTELILPGVEEGQCSSSGEVTGSIGESLTELHSIDSSSEVGIPGAMPKKSMDLSDVSTRRKRVLIDAKAVRIGKVRAKVAKELEDILSIGPCNRLSSL